VAGQKFAPGVSKFQGEPSPVDDMRAVFWQRFGRVRIVGAACAQRRVKMIGDLLNGWHFLA